MECFTISLDAELARSVSWEAPDLQVGELHALIAERGVRHGQLNLVAVEVGQHHAHGDRPRRHGGSHHVHLKPSR